MTKAKMKGKIFESSEIISILSKQKTQFREVIKPSAGLQSRWASVQGLSKCPTNYLCEVDGDLGAQFQHPLAGTQQSCGEVDKMSPYGWFKCPYQVGQKIFCKESFADFRSNNSDIFYKSDFEINNLAKIAELKWSPAQHMKQEHSRLNLQITEVRVEKLSEISEKDLKLEGFKTDYKIRSDGIYKKDAIKFFQEEWNSTHKKLEEKFEANPWVFVYQFELVR